MMRVLRRLRGEAEFLFFSDALPEEVVPVADEQKEMSNQNRVKLRAAAVPKGRFRQNHDEKKLVGKLRKEKDQLTRKDLTFVKPRHLKV
jgi:hypothetical protein